MLCVYLADPLTEERSALRLPLLGLKMEVVAKQKEWKNYPHYEKILQ